MEGTASTLVTELISTLTTTASQMEGAIGDVMGVALPLAGSILVITIGWRLFRNFTRG